MDHLSEDALLLFCCYAMYVLKQPISLVSPLLSLLLSHVGPLQFGFSFGVFKRHENGFEITSQGHFKFSGSSL